MIEIPQEWQPVDDYSSHRPLLYMALQATDDLPVTEFGCGNGSTPLLHKYCNKHNRRFFSYDDIPQWAEKFDYVTPISDYTKIHLSDGTFKQGILFIDNAPGELRKDLIQKHANHAHIIIVHDTEPGAEYVYHMADVLSTFKYRLDYRPEGMPHTTAVSNFIDVSQWKL